jgi:pimeloyl-ACP methyl ester carboxylesterase
MSQPAPVIFIPGIMGSALRDEYPTSPDNVWSVLKAATKNYERITLHPDNIKYELVEPARVVKDQVFDLFYSEIIEELRHNLSRDPDKPVPVYPFAYDWRQPLDVIQDQFSLFVQEVIARTSLMRHYNKDGYTESTGKVNLVGHSMGGLIAAGYVQAVGLRWIDKVATIASPFRGSLEAIAKTAIGVGGFTFSSGGSREREAARVTPALYHLLPSFKGAVVTEDGKEADIFLAENWQQGILNTLATFVERYGLSKSKPDTQAKALLTAMLDQAWKHRLRLERLKLDDSKRWLCIVGVDGKTRLGMTLQFDPKTKKPFFALGEATNEWNQGGDKTRTGDNTVPFRGARCGFIPENQIICLSPDEFGFFEFKDRLINELGFHSALPSMNLVQRLVVSHFLGSKMGKLEGHPSPEIDPNTWDPPVKGVERK